MNKKFKYVTMGAMGSSLRSAILFPELINHNEIATSFCATTAGFCQISFTGERIEDLDGNYLDVVKVRVWGKSTSLGNIESHDSDRKLIAETIGCILFEE